MEVLPVPLLDVTERNFGVFTDSREIVLSGIKGDNDAESTVQIRVSSSPLVSVVPMIG